MGKLRFRGEGRLIKVRQPVSGRDRMQTRNTLLRRPGSTHCVRLSQGSQCNFALPLHLPE